MRFLKSVLTCLLVVSCFSAQLIVAEETNEESNEEEVVEVVEEEQPQEEVVLEEETPATEEPVVEEEPTPEVTEEPTPEVTAEPTPVVTEGPTPEATTEPLLEETVEPTIEPTEAPTPEATVEPSLEVEEEKPVEEASEELNEEEAEIVEVEEEIEENELQNITKINPGRSMATAYNYTILSGFDNSDAGRYFETTDTNDYFVKFSVTNEDAAGAGTYFKIRVVEENSILVCYSLVDVSGAVVNGIDSGFAFQEEKNTKLRAGTYYLRMKTGTKNKTMSFSVTKQKDDATNDYSGASAIKTNQRYSRVLETNEDVDWFKFTASSTSQQLTLMNSTVSNNLVLELYDNNLRKIDTGEEVRAAINNSSQIVVNGLNKGQNYYIKVSTWNASGEYSFTISDFRPVTSIKLNKTKVEFDSGKSTQLKVTFSPSNASDKTIKWSTSNWGLEVDANGKVTSSYPGTYTVTAESHNGKKATATITVRDMNACVINGKNTNLAWEYKDGKQYWYENGKKQGIYGQKGNVWYDGTERGREIYDPCSDGWYWLDAKYSGAKAVSKEVFMPYIFQNEKSMSDAEKRRVAGESNTYHGFNNVGLMSNQVYDAMVRGTGKWVRYDYNGKMVKGWYNYTTNGQYKYHCYYYDWKTGMMAKGWTTIDGQTYYFDPITGVLKNN